MIFANKNFTAEINTLSFGEIKGFYIGTEGCGRHAVFVPSNIDVKNGVNENLTIELSRSGKPKIVEKYDPDIYAILSTYSGYTRRGCGRLIFWNNKNIEVMVEGNGADGAAGGIGSWTESIVALKENFCLKVKYSGGQYSNPHGVNWFLFPWKEKILFFPWVELKDWIDLQTGNLPEWVNLSDTRNFVFEFDGLAKQARILED